MCVHLVEVGMRREVFMCVCSVADAGEKREVGAAGGSWSHNYCSRAAASNCVTLHVGHGIS